MTPSACASGSATSTPGPARAGCCSAGRRRSFPRATRTTQFFGGASIPTDLYFSCLDGSWNADGDALWGEGYASASDPGDDVDLLPEVWVGRAPVTNTAEAHAFVVRSIQAALEPAHPRPPRALLAAEVLFPQVWSQGDAVSLDGAQLAEELLPRLTAGGFASRRLYENYLDPLWTAGSEPLSRQAFLDAFDDGHDLVLVFDAQTQTELGMGGSEVVSVPDIEALTNTIPLSHVYLWGGEGPLGPDSPIGPAFFHTPGGSPGGAATVVGLTQFAFPTALACVRGRVLPTAHRRGREGSGRDAGPLAAPVRSVLGLRRREPLDADGARDVRRPAAEPAAARRAGDFALTAPPTVDVGGGGIPVHVTEDGIAEARRRRDRLPRGRGDRDGDDRRAGRCDRAVRRACAGRHLAHRTPGRVADRGREHRGDRIHRGARASRRHAIRVCAAPAQSQLRGRVLPLERARRPGGRPFKARAPRSRRARGSHLGRGGGQPRRPAT